MNSFQAIVSVIGRILLSQIFIISGVGKAANPEGTIGYIQSVGAPLPEVASKQRHHLLSEGVEPREWCRRGGDIEQPVAGALLGFFECLEQVHRDPWMPVQHLGL